ncbi:EAL domain-containing protein [Staphylococcus epidermidis]|nr:EAL domain-containing protein [Staphylococcus epidermidis]
MLCNHPICVNISTKQLQQPDFSEQVEGIITHTGINPAFLWLEMSTRSLSPIGGAASRSLTRLSALGVRLRSMISADLAAHRKYCASCLCSKSNWPIL